MRKFSREGTEAAKGEFSEAIRLDPNFARALGWRAYVCIVENQEGWADDVGGNFALAVDLAERGVSLAPLDYYTRWNLASVYAGDKQTIGRAEAEYNRALALNPNDPDMHTDIADMYSYLGEPDKAIEHMEKAMELKFPLWYPWSYAFAFFQKEQYQEAIVELEKMVDPPNTAYLLWIVCKVLAEEEEDIPAADEIKEKLLGKDPQWTPDHLEKFPFGKDADNARYVKALKDAGVLP
jgi:adenylate cyclase